MRYGIVGQESATNSGKAWTAALKSAESETAGIKDSSCTSGAQARSGAGGDEAAMAPIGLEGDRVAVTGTRTTAVSAEVEPLLLNWLREKAPDCGDNSCLFGGRGKGGMRTNGGCRCFKDVRPDMHRIFIERMWQAVSSMPSATASTMLDEAIELLRSVEFTTAVVAKCPVCLGFEKDGNGETSRHHNATCKLADFLRRSDSGKADK